MDVDATGGVAFWKTASTQANQQFDLSQFIASHRPKRVANAINGYPAVRFDGVDDFLHYHGAGSSRSIVMVVKFTAIGGPLGGDTLRQNAWYGPGPDGLNQLFNSQLPTGTWYVNGQQIADPMTIGYALGQYRILSFVSTEVKGFSTLGTDSKQDGNVIDETFLKGEIVEVIHRNNNSFSASSLQNLHNHLSAKYNIPLSGN